ncbi:MAG: hypothetical protein AAB225_04890 [Acidobacteriota bacterium]
MFENRAEQDFRVLQDRCVRGLTGHGVFEQPRELENALALGEIQEPARQLGAYVERRVLLLCRERAQRGCLAAPGRAKDE